MALTLGLELLFFEALNTSYIYPITSKVCFVKGLVNSILTYVPNMIHICPNNNLLEKSLDLVEEQRENVIVQLVYYQQKLK